MGWVDFHVLTMQSHSIIHVHACEKRKHSILLRRNPHPFLPHRADPTFFSFLPHSPLYYILPLCAFLLLLLVFCNASIMIAMPDDNYRTEEAALYHHKDDIIQGQWTS